MRRYKKNKKIEYSYQPTNLFTEGLDPKGIYKLNLKGKLIFLAIAIIFGIIIFIEVN